MRFPTFLLLLVSLTLATLAAAATTTVDLAGDEPTLACQRDGSGDYTVEVRVGALQFFDVATSSGTFSRVVIPGFHASRSVGQPCLPTMNRLIATPAGATATVEVIAQQTRRIRLADRGIVHPLMPAQPSLAKNAAPATVPFLLDADSYGRAGLAAAAPLAQVVAQGRLRAVDFARLEVAPVRYDPVAGEVEVTESLTLRVHFEGADPAAGADLDARTWSPYFEAVYSRIEGARGLHDSYPDHVRDEVTYVIITPDMFTAQLADFIQWKTERGFRVTVGEIGSPAVGTTTATIQNYIHGLYENASAEAPAPSFVLFVGDVAQCPTFQMSGDPTDRPYCAVDGDNVPDIFYGRFSATNADQLQAILDKTMMYDQFTMPDPAYLDEVVLIAGYDSNFGPTHGNGTINYATGNYFNAAHGIDADVHLYPDCAGQASQIVAEVSEGRGFVNYTAHGSQTSWSNPSFTQSNIAGLQNAGKYGLVIGNCCLTSTYDYGECFAETWLRAENKGAIGYIGGSNSTYWDEDVYWSVGNTAVIQAVIRYSDTDYGAYDGLWHDHGEDEDLFYVTQDAVVFCGNLAVQESGSGLTNYYWNIYNLMGDPSITPYMGVPESNPVTHPMTVDLTATAVTIGAADCSYVGLTQGGQLLGAGTIHVGQAAVTVNFLAPLQDAVPVMLVVMAPDCEPYVVEIPISGDTTGAPDTAPAVLTLDSAHPNPFNPQTVIEFGLPHAAAVELAVFDLRGQRVAILVNDVRAAGRHQATWRGRDDAGRLVASGTYIYRLAAGDETRCGTMVLTK